MGVSPAGISCCQCCQCCTLVVQLCNLTSHTCVLKPWWRHTFPGRGVKLLVYAYWNIILAVSLRDTTFYWEPTGEPGVGWGPPLWMKVVVVTGGRSWIFLQCDSFSGDFTFLLIFFSSSPWINYTQWFLIRSPAASGTFWRYTLDQDLRAGSELNIQSTCPVQLKGGESEWDVNLWRSKVNSGCFPPGLQDGEIKPSDCINKQDGRRVNLVTQLLRSDALGARSRDGHPGTWTSWWCCWIEKKVLIILLMAKRRRHKTDKFYWVKH